MGNLRRSPTRSAALWAPAFSIALGAWRCAAAQPIVGIEDFDADWVAAEPVAISRLRTRAVRLLGVTAEAFMRCGARECSLGTAELVQDGSQLIGQFRSRNATATLTIGSGGRDQLRVLSELTFDGSPRTTRAEDLLRRVLVGVSFRRGDVNADGAFDIADALRTLEFLFLDGATPPCVRAADANDDGRVDIADGIGLLEFLFLGGPAPAAPFAECDLDRTPDLLSCIAHAPCVPPPPPPDQNPTVPDVLAAFAEVRTHGDKLGFHVGPSFPGEYSSAGSHFQGIQRLSSGQYLAVSGSSSEVAHLFIVKMASRPALGRFRSNRLMSNEPPSGDRIVRVVETNRELLGDPSGDLGRPLSHAGGIQVIGDVVVIGIEGGGRSRVVFYDVESPESPRKLGYEIDRPSAPAGACGIVHRADGRYLLLVGRSESNILDFYLSTGTSLRDGDPGFEPLDTWFESELRAENGMDREFGDHQNLSLLRQPDGQEFVIGFHRNLDFLLGDDFADLFRLDVQGSQAVLTKVANRHMVCQDECNYDAGAGLYVHPSGELGYYGVEHWPDQGWVKFNEFRRVPASVSPPLSSIEDGWVELYDDTGFGDRSVMIDFVDRSLRNYADYDAVEGFEDKTSALKWLLPSGWSCLLFEDKNFKGALLGLPGNGNVQVISRLADRGWNDLVSSSRFEPTVITSIDEGWIELFDDSGFTDRRLTIRGHAAGIRNYEDITVEGVRGFGDKVSSVRWRLPEGFAYRLYQHDTFRGDTLDLVGNGRIREISSLGGFGDETSSSRFLE